MKSTRYTITFRDAGKALMVTVIGNLIVFVMGIPDAGLPTWAMILTNLITSLKFGFLPYMLKNFFSDDVQPAIKLVEKITAADEPKKD